MARIAYARCVENYQTSRPRQTGEVQCRGMHGREPVVFLTKHVQCQNHDLFFLMCVMNQATVMVWCLVCRFVVFGLVESFCGWHERQAKDRRPTYTYIIHIHHTHTSYTYIIHIHIHHTHTSYTYIIHIHHTSYIIHHTSYVKYGLFWTWQQTQMSRVKSRHFKPAFLGQFNHVKFQMACGQEQTNHYSNLNNRGFDESCKIGFL